ncbi:hypothetical protein [Chromobacterium aquaticum]|uniref:Uncharacterized protein n=1 Tax=Chromobacterium aquaticum TaxID=467180 RepID=A0ABV8ZMX1_9NEIS|nr:hypothetical protein [Chromobacterium aquaticum]MCD5361249.1 hypothetical protein [Chromobacterium aquaticum]
MGMKIKLEILENGDEIVGFSEGRLAVKKSNGELEIFSLSFDENNIPRVHERSVLVTFKSGSAKKVSVVDDDGDFEIGSF